MNNKQLNNTNRNHQGKQNHSNHSNHKQNGEQRPRTRRVTVDREVEVVIVSNSLGRFYYANPRMSMVIDLHKIGDEEYVTVGDLRTILNSNRSILEGFDILITEVMDSNYTVEDVLIFLGLDKKYNQFFSLTRKSANDKADVSDIKNFIIKTPANSFEKIMKNIDDKLRSKVIENAVTLFKLKEFSDYNKMKVIEGYVNDELFDDAEETEVDEGIYIG